MSRAPLGIVYATALVLAVTACGQSSPEPSTAPAPSPSASASRESARKAEPAPSDRSTTSMRIVLTLDGHRAAATLNDSTAARDLATLLPLTVDLEDFHGTERIGYPARKLDTTGAPDASHPKAGDLAYYTPRGNLALFYRDGDRSPSLVILGSLDNPKDTDHLAAAERVRIEAAS
ncbi:cyclophilin-like fold protein [Streptomyces aculeolatus]